MTKFKIFQESYPTQKPEQIVGMFYFPHLHKAEKILRASNNFTAKSLTARGTNASMKDHLTYKSLVPLWKDENAQAP